VLRSILLAVLAALLGAAAVKCAAVVFAELAMARPRASMDRWEQGDSIGTHRVRQRLLDRIHMAIAAHPGDADAFAQLGRLYAWHASFHVTGSDRHQLFSRRALAAFQHARQRRPTWGYAWVREAEQRATLGAEPDDVWPLLQRADALSPREPETQLKLLWVALRWWPRLDAARQARLRRGYRRLLADPAYHERTRRLLRHYQLGEPLARGGVPARGAG
jgi:hypothetical protein